MYPLRVNEGTVPCILNTSIRGDELASHFGRFTSEREQVITRFGGRKARRFGREISINVTRQAMYV